MYIRSVKLALVLLLVVCVGSCSARVGAVNLNRHGRRLRD